MPLHPTPTLTTEEAIAHVAQGMTSCTLPKAEWTHEAHWAAALWLLRHAPDLATPAAMGRAIRAYNESVGGQNTDTSGYHETITIASIRAAGDCLARGGDAPLPQVLAGLMHSHLGGPEWLLAYWRRETLFSAEARRVWVAPDLADLPF